MLRNSFQIDRRRYDLWASRVEPATVGIRSYEREVGLTGKQQRGPKIYTRTGDEGETGLFGGPRVRKDALRVEAYGAVDELNAVIGVAVTTLSETTLVEMLRKVQSTLFDLGGELASPDVEARVAANKVTPQVSTAAVTQLEMWIDLLDEKLTPLTQFILPGGVAGAALLHHARTVCRRAERRVVTLKDLENVSGETLHYLNRLSDFLFVAARTVNQQEGMEEVRWSSQETP